MQQKLAPWATALLTVVGAVMFGAFFLAWITDGPSGFSLAWDGERWLFLAPIAGAALAAAAATGASYTRLAAIVAGVVVAGDVGYELLKGVVHGGLDLWLMLGGALVVLAGAPEKNKALRAVGGIAVLVGFFAPWTESTFSMLTSEAADFARMMGISVRVLWLIPLAGVGAIASSAVGGKKLAIASGLGVFGALMWMIGSVANMVFAWGAWMTLGASAIALVVGVLAPGSAPSSAQPAAKAA